MNITIMQNIAKESKPSIVRNIAKTAGLLALGLGILSWNGITHVLVPVHIILGVILGVSIVILAYQAVRSGLPTWLAALAVVWIVSVGIYGILQQQIFPNNQSLTHILHLFGGLGAIGMSEILAVETKKIRAKVTGSGK